MKTFKELLCLVLMMALGFSACKKDKDDDETQGGPSTPPPWLISYMGTYTGTYDGGDHGTWIIIVDSSEQLTIEIYSIPDDDTTTCSGKLFSNGTLLFENDEARFKATIFDNCEVDGTWESNDFNKEGTLKGWKDPNSETSLLILIEDKEAGWAQKHMYDDEKRHVRTHFYDNEVLGDYAIRSWDEQEVTYTYYWADGSVCYAYRNPYPFNSQGLAEYATYIMYSGTYTQYDTCYFQYSAAGFMLGQDRQMSRVYGSGIIKTGNEIRTYTYSDNNLTQMEVLFSMEGDTSNATYTSTYYMEYKNYQNNITPYLGKSNQNLLKSSEVTHSNGNYFNTELYYEFHEVGLIKREHGKTVSNLGTYYINSSYYYK